MGAVRGHGRPRLDELTRLDGVVAVGVDETVFQHASPARVTSFVTGIVDLTRGRGPARLLDVVAGRSASGLVKWMNQREPGWRAAVKTAALDPYRGYAAALRTALPHAVRVLDAFHVTRLGFAAVDEVRRRLQREQTGHRGRAGDPLFGIRRVLRRGFEHHSERSWTKLLAGLDAGDTDDEQLARTWIAAQELRLIFSCPDRPRAQAHLYRWLAYCADAAIPELTRLARTIDSWHTELLAYFDTNRISNGPTEAINLLIKKIKRVGLNRPSGLGQVPALDVRVFASRTRCCCRLAMRRAWRATSLSQPRAWASSRRAMASASWSRSWGMNSVPVVKLSHCSQMLA
jgi:hypothetical protein